MASIIKRKKNYSIARKAAEERTGVPVITSKNATQLNQVVTNLLEGVVADANDDPDEGQK